MVENPKVGMECWIITDLWEAVCPIPVTVIAEDREGGVFLCRWPVHRIEAGAREQDKRSSSWLDGKPYEARVLRRLLQRLGAGGENNH